MISWIKQNNIVCNFVINRFYHVKYKSYGDTVRELRGFLIHYDTGNIVMIGDNGLYIIKYSDIDFMVPVCSPTAMSKEYMDFIENFLKLNKVEEKE